MLYRDDNENKRTILSAILDRVEGQIRQIVIPEVPDTDETNRSLELEGYDLLRLGKPNEDFRTPLRGCYRDLRDIERLDKDFRVPSVFLLLDTGYFRGNQDSGMFTGMNFPLNAIVTKFPVLLRTLMKQETGLIVKESDCDDRFDNYDFLTTGEWDALETDLDKSYKSTFNAGAVADPLTARFTLGTAVATLTEGEIANLPTGVTVCGISKVGSAATSALWDLTFTRYLVDSDLNSVTVTGNSVISRVRPGESLTGQLRKTPITDQISNLLEDFDSVLNPFTLAGKQAEYPPDVAVLDAFITSVECLQGVLSPYEVVDYTLELTFYAPKTMGPNPIGVNFIGQ